MKNYSERMAEGIGLGMTAAEASDYAIEHVDADEAAAEAIVEDDEVRRMVRDNPALVAGFGGRRSFETWLTHLRGPFPSADS